jgi:hypothetical protein
MIKKYKNPGVMLSGFFIDYNNRDIYHGENGEMSTESIVKAICLCD